MDRGNEAIRSKDRIDKVSLYQILIFLILFPEKNFLIVDLLVIKWILKNAVFAPVFGDATF